MNKVSSAPRYSARWDFSPIYRGDTLDPIKLTLKDKDTGEAIMPVSVCSEFRTMGGKLVHRCETEVDLNTGSVIIYGVSGVITREWRGGELKFDVEYTLPDGRVRTYLYGFLEVLEDVSRCHAP